MILSSSHLTRRRPLVGVGVLAVLASAAACADSSGPASADASSEGASGSAGGSGTSSGSTGGSGTSVSGAGAGTSGAASSGSTSALDAALGSQEASADTGGPSGSDGSALVGVGADIGGANAVIHDDFESGSLASWRLKDAYGNLLSTSSTALTLDATRAHSGGHSLKIHDGGFVEATPPAAAFYGRFWVWLATDPSPGRGSGPHWGWVDGVGSLSGMAVEVRQGGQFGLLEDNITPSDDIVISDPNVFSDSTGGARPPIATWTCVEFFYGKDSLRTWLNGAEITALDVTPTTVWGHGQTVAPWSPPYEAIRVGFAGYNGNPIDLWIDDVALDTKKIGCQ